MCGVFAIVGSSKQPIDPVTIDRALGTLDRRGPDGRGVWSSPRNDVALAHTRLAIVDLENGAQPMTNEDGSIILSFNGELYGHAEMRRDLEKRGHQFKSRCDAEIIVHLYEELGGQANDAARTALLEKLRGEFAFVLWDEKHRVCFAARDRFGVKPLVYAEQEDGALLIASRARTLFAAGVPARWDEAALFQAMSLQYTLPDQTLFAGVRALPAGHFLVRQGDDGVTHVRKYWDLDYPTLESLNSSGSANVEQCAEELRVALDDAVRVRLEADVPVAFQLSGGIDSSAVLALASTAPRDAFTISFNDDARYDERAIAEEMARHVGANLHVVETSRARLIDELPVAIADGEGFSVNAHIAAKRILSRAIRDAGFKVVLTGEGADEVLAGYAHFRADLGAGGATGATLSTTNTASSGLMLPQPGSDELDTSSVAQALGFVPTWLRAKANLGARLHSVLASSTNGNDKRDDAFTLTLAHFDVAGQLHGRGRVEQASYLWSKLALEGYILRTLGDGMEMAHSIEGRVPFLDHRLFELIRSFPTHFKINSQGVEKAVLRMAVGPMLTERLRTKQKHPFLAPPILASENTNANANANAAAIFDRLRGASLPAFFDAAKVAALLNRLPTMSPEDRIATEPALMMMLSASVLQSTYRL